MGSAAVVLGAAPTALALPVIDDFLGGPHTVSLISIVPPEIATGSFLHAGAVGGVRDVFVTSSTTGIFGAGVSFGTGGFASFAGAGSGGVLWDGVSGPVDKNSDGIILIEDDFDFGLNLDFVENCENPLLHLQAFADLAGGEVVIALANSATEYALYSISLTTVGAFDDYYFPVLTPTFATGGFDPTAVAAVAMGVNGASAPDLDVRVSLLAVTCPVIPEPGTWVAFAGLVGAIGVTWRRARSVRA